MKFSYNIVVECDLRMHTDGEFQMKTSGRQRAQSGRACLMCVYLLGGDLLPVRHFLIDSSIPGTVICGVLVDKSRLLPIRSLIFLTVFWTSSTSPCQPFQPHYFPSFLNLQLKEMGPCFMI